MDVLYHLKETKEYVTYALKQSYSIGFVPTMGALHRGHLSLIEKSTKENNLTICSIFINPIQFNNKDDFEKYPVRSEKDIDMLKQTGCNMLFMPTVNEMYPEPVKDLYDFGMLDKVMEGASREGHFNGVAIVVKKLFEIIKPTKAYFGEKDFQQLQIISNMVKKEQIPVEIVACPIIREADGLAMSSRNMRLTPEERSIAPYIYRALKKCSEFKRELSVEQLKSLFIKSISEFPQIKLDYFEIADENTLQPINKWFESENPRMFVALFLGQVRLIDNMKIIL